MGDGDEQLLQVILIERHLVDVPEDAPIYEVTHKAGQACDSLALDLFKSHVDMLGSNLLGGEVISTIERGCSAWFLSR